MLSLLMVVLTVPLINLQKTGVHSFMCGRSFGRIHHLALFVITDLRAREPLVPFRSLWSAKAVSGTVMAVASHIAIIVSLAGINGFWKHCRGFFESMTRFICVFRRDLATAVLSTLCMIIWRRIARLYRRFGNDIVGMEWRSVQPGVSMESLYLHAVCWAAASAWYWYRERWARRLPEIFTKLQNARFRFTLSAISPVPGLHR
ncbi:hypothetical protein PO124_09650 [Bacillus licheniformis]|nr:hypothetical protein [Bacillus licheniformis]